ncbi:antitermination protein [Escherichia coli]|uniref:antitermination protein Q n=1 Tax=Escherichia coli TaxID=562 RepID=UPI003974E07A
MRVLLRPVLVPELGLVVLKPGRESIQIFHNPRVLVEPEPKSMRNLPSGVVPAVRQPLAEDKTLLPFFSNERVIRAAGGVGALSDWLLRHVTSCQWPNGDYHHTETVIHRYSTGAMVLCWHCDNQLRDQTSESLELKELCQHCHGKGEASTACRGCKGKGIVLDEKRTRFHGVPVYKICGRCNGNRFSRLPTTLARRHVQKLVPDLTDYQWYKGYADVIGKLVTKCWQEEAYAEAQLRKVTR